MKKYEDIILKILQKEIKPAIGCTEPIAVAYATSIARDIISERLEDIKKIKIRVNSNIYKNGMGVFVPGTKKKGLFYAAALGLLKGDSSLGLEVLKNVVNDDAIIAMKYLKEDIISIDYIPNTPNVFVEVIIETNDNNVKAILENRHDEIKDIYLNKEKLLKEDIFDRLGFEVDIKDSKGEEVKESEEEKFLLSVNILDYIDMIKQMDATKLAFLEKAMLSNEKIGEFGVENKIGMGVGYTLKKMMDDKLIGRDLINLSKAYTAGASDARMSGENFVVYSCAGSGNQGLTSSVPIIVSAKELKKSKEDTLKALAISFMVTITVKQYMGRLSALCACSIAAGVGTSVALGYLFDMDKKLIEKGVNNIIGNITGMICDGAKPGCALKLATSIDTVMEMMILAKEGSCILPREGIVCKDVMSSIRNIGRLSTKGMTKADDLILDIMINR